MVDTYSISLEGMRNAQLRLEDAARMVSGARSKVPAGPVAGADSVQLTATGQDAPVDFAQQAVNLMEAKIGHEAATKLLTTQREIDGITLDLFA
jgi:hypothetical protein